MTEREGFEKWWPSVGQTIGKSAARLAWVARQPEIDALKAEIALSNGTIESRDRNIAALWHENTMQADQIEYLLGEYVKRTADLARLKETADKVYLMALEKAHLNDRMGSWLAAALDDPKVCEEMKADIRAWFGGIS